ncbi:MAG: GAF domain-containing protein [Sphingobacteriaceae bacterium]|nr:MAG: GAF domain-containing protein [Sphingobacteriaceae bacterium]
MHTSILNINDDHCVACQVETRLSFKPLMNHLEERLKTEHPIKAQFYRFLLERLYQIDGGDLNITLADIEKHRDTMVLIYTILTPLVADEKDFFWAMSTAVPDKIFFSTDAFYSFYTNHLRNKNEAEFEEDSIEKKQVQFIYQLILKKFYNFTSIFKNEKIYTFTDPETNLNRYYSIHADTRFIDIHVKDELPELDFEKLGAEMHTGTEIELLHKLLPLTNFRLDGFTIITLTDITVTQAIDNIRSVLVNHTYEREAYPQIIQSLRTLVGNADIEFGLMPFLTVNDKLVFDAEQCVESVLMEAAKDAGISDEMVYNMVEEYRKDPKPIFYTNITDEKAVNNPFLRIIRHAGIYAYTLIPIFHNKQLAGVLEMHTRKEIMIDELLLSKVRGAIPLLAQLFQYGIDAFNAKIDAILKDKFTSLQPSVQWKFNDVAFNYLKKKSDGEELAVIDTVMFEDTYPLFGAIDIRNSTIERNKALQDDLKNLLEILTNTLKTVSNLVELSLIDKLIYDTGEWIIKINEYTNTNDEILLSNFLELEVNPLLEHVKASNPLTEAAINTYFNAVKEETGQAFQKRRELEEAMQLINTSVSSYLETEQIALQKSYPCYFSKFRTDGVEYDIYIGQSIAPFRPFSNLYLKNLRLWQIRSMAEIARLTRKLAGKMHNPLSTTQLIFIHSNPINISFRNDERRFDVEGAYNIRYEIIKKRIDKVHVKGTAERLTQPDKIALVYFNHNEASEYMQYVQYLQEQGYLTNEVERLELEELQGVSGLNAIRIGVKYPENK